MIFSREVMMLNTQLLPPHTDDDRFWIESTFFEPNSKKKTVTF